MPAVQQEFVKPIVIDISESDHYILIISPTVQLPYKTMAGALARALRYLKNAPNDPADGIFISRSAADKSNLIHQ